jgi:hypothetical protein
MSAWSWPATQGDAVLGHQAPASRGLKRHWPSSVAHARRDGATTAPPPGTADVDRSQPPGRSQHDPENRIAAGHPPLGT